MNERHRALDAAIRYIHENLDEPLPLDRLAKYTAYSSFHFSRIFKERYGLPPLYYISSLRLQRAKELLLSSDLPVRDIAMEIGQQSLGTFTTRFTQRVGMTPNDFRNSVRMAGEQLSVLRGLPDWNDKGGAEPRAGEVQGRVSSAESLEGAILIGLFPKPIPEGLPLYGTVLPSFGEFRFSGVRPGTYYLMATSVSWNSQAEEVLVPKSTLRTRSRTPVVVDKTRSVPYQDVYLYPPALDDPPILISLSVLMNNFLSRIHSPARLQP